MRASILSLVVLSCWGALLPAAAQVPHHPGAYAPQAPIYAPAPPPHYGPAPQVPCEPTAPPGGKCWVRAEYLLWWISSDEVPPLVTTGSLNDPIPGALGQPGTVVLFGGDVDYDVLHGGRLTVGTWFDCKHTFGAELSAFLLTETNEDFVASSDGTTILARPFFDIVNQRQDAEAVAFPGLVAGSVTVSASSRMHGGEANLLCNLCCTCCSRVDLIGGLRYVELEEDITIAEDQTLLIDVPTIGPAGTRIQVVDRFETRNRFLGGQIGARAEYWKGGLFATLTGKVAIGLVEQQVDISGFTSITPPGGATTTLPGGLLALSNNIGRHERDEFAVIPELNLSVGYQLCDNARVFAGYSLLYWSNVARPGDQISLAIDPTLVPTSLAPPSGVVLPRFEVRDSDLWLHGLNVGVELRF